MKLIIDVDEPVYEAFKIRAERKEPVCCTENAYLIQKVLNGTPYNPTGDCISREWVKTNFAKEFFKALGSGNDTSFEIFGTVKKVIDNAPTVPQINVFCENADEKAIESMKAELQSVIEARPKGEWKEWTDERWGGTTIYCPYCKEEALEKYIDGLQRQVKSNFCPNCGVKLEKGGAE